MSVYTAPASIITAEQVAAQPSGLQIEAFNILWDLMAEITSEALWANAEPHVAADKIGKIMNEIGLRLCNGAATPADVMTSVEMAEKWKTSRPDDHQETIDISEYAVSIDEVDHLFRNLSAHVPRPSYIELILTLSLRLLVELEHNVDEGPAHLHALIINERQAFSGTAAALALCECENPEAHVFEEFNVELRPAIIDTADMSVGYIA